MTKSLEYIGTAERYWETAVTGKQQGWRRGQTQDVSDADAVALLATGLFVSGYADAIPESNQAAGKPVTAVTDANGNVTGLSVGGVTLTSSGAEFLKMPWGVHGYLNNNNIFPHAALGFERGKLVAFSQTGAAYRYNAGAWTLAHAAGAISNGAVTCLTMTQNGYLYAGFSVATAATDPQQGKLFRSIDGGATWVAVYTIPTPASAVPVSPRSITESSNGTLFCNYYPTTVSNSYNLLLKSTDNGANWVDITANLAQVPSSHIHTTYYCPYRNLLFVMHGDSGGSSKVQVSADLGVTFQSWQTTVQTTSMTSDSRYIYMSLDAGNNRQVVRVDCPISRNPATDNCESIIVYETPEATNLGGFAWWGMAKDGLVFFVYGAEGPARIVASSSYGDPNTWQVVYEFGVGSAGSFCHVPIFPTAYAEGRWDGVFYGLDPARSGARMSSWSIAKRGDKLNINGVDGSPFYDGYRRSKKELTGFEPPSTSVFVGKAAPIAAPTLMHSTGFEQGLASPFILNSSAGVMSDPFSNLNPKSGSRHHRGAYNTASGNAAAQVTPQSMPQLTVAGQSHWMHGDFSFNTSSAGSDVTFMRMDGTSVGYWQVRATAATRTLKLVSYDGVSLNEYTDLSTVLPINEYFRLKFRIVFSRTATGRATVWVNGQIKMDIDNIITVGAAGDVSIPLFGMYGNLPGVVVDMDNLAYAQNGDTGG